MKLRITPQRARRLKACGCSMLIHAVCIGVAVALSTNLFSPAPKTNEVIITLQPDEPATPPLDSADEAKPASLAGKPEPPPLPQPHHTVPASPNLQPAASETFAHSAPLLSELPSFTIPAPGETSKDETTAGITMPLIGHSSTKDEHSEIDSYFAIFTQTLRDAYEIPATLGPKRELAVRIQYEVAADGTIGEVTILRTSGSTVFDASVVAAFRAMRTVGPRPDNRSSVLVADFRI
ncbi:TonB family protein [Ereboglobus luteus]|uniref:TonB C-terminal domain-containing protein n=1 Tax=Ereboglobus luteus TaxID=1796921 RepID=A0A2U8E267_9BACT|nr:TonB family protein [Ereboglobus luteus]AWI08931.1 hypothetical protein CKA38_06390 [Ereboglobus luteus]